MRGMKAVKWFKKEKETDAGRWGENKASEMLAEKGFKVMGNRVRVDARSEIDVLARDGEVLVFVEVKTRGSEDFGRPMDAVDRRKRQVLSRAAVRYLRKKGNPAVKIRFDVVEVVGDAGTGVVDKVRHIENAFQLDRKYILA